ncbi:50S ribosomal protein L31 [Candidatus Carsonella ruddii]|uniref:50S ribosomal protein L31 n=1 Tax=Candidatus Carsonella ruddii PC isolate NHV TaxID=1202540 RepID=J3YQL5_CARRU|nr:50S ribosomal protein L31 [Candidatus Carsonella ruddii]AFP84253.1 ribosomal protein L31 [Candidatus Carsonella ruddii PC isolate NHV]
MKTIFCLCVCGKSYQITSNFDKNINTNICSNCHSFFTKKKNTYNNSVKAVKFNKKYELFFKK